MPMDNLDFSYAKVHRRIPVVFTHQEASAVLAQLRGDYQMMGNLMYGSVDCWVSECSRLRIGDTAINKRLRYPNDSRAFGAQ